MSEERLRREVRTLRNVAVAADEKREAAEKEIARLKERAEDAEQRLDNERGEREAAEKERDEAQALADRNRELGMQLLEEREAEIARLREENERWRKTALAAANEALEKKP